MVAGMCIRTYSGPNVSGSGGEILCAGAVCLGMYVYARRGDRLDIYSFGLVWGFWSYKQDTLLD